MAGQEPDSRPRRATVQDDARERQIADLLRLQRGDRRVGTDAVDEDGRSYELKSTTKSGIGTGRDVGEAYFSAMRSRYLVCAFGSNTQFGFHIDALYVLAPSALEPWIAPRRQKMTDDLAILERLLAAAGESVTVDDAERLRYLIQRGTTLNNPKIGRNYIDEHGLRLTSDEPASELRNYVRANPILDP